MVSKKDADGVHAWIYNSRGQLLLQLRHSSKDIHPGKWDISAAGRVKKWLGETPEQAMIREAEEELGVKLEPGELVFIGVTDAQSPLDGEWGKEANYIVLRNLNLVDLKLRPGEVADVAWHDLEEIEADLSDDVRRNKYAQRHPDLYALAIAEIRAALKNTVE